MRASIRPIGNPAGIILPKKGCVVLVPAEIHPRAGWAEAVKKAVAAGDDGLVWPEIANDKDDHLTW